MNINLFIEELKKINIEISEEQINKFEIYKELIKDYNKKFNLTSIIEDDDIYLKHFFDSLCIFKVKEINEVNNLLDIGSGAGFPGIPIAIINNNINVTLVESNEKKCNFLKIVKEKLKLDNLEVINERAEEYVKKTRESFDIATSRAVSHLKILAEIEMPSLKINGLFLPLKSSFEKELQESKQILDIIGGKVEEIISYNLPIENSLRTILKIKKTKHCDSQYPREYSKIIKDLKNIKK